MEQELHKWLDATITISDRDNKKIKMLFPNDKIKFEDLLFLVTYTEDELIIKACSFVDPISY